ncbi:hypothetical protein Q4S45_07750 [Massilia sp. R2A-15]|uniref:hypothetical protein n=1 Tax=Massilia sp. R2A-15 TaxID=3064278 RepID=UPI002734EBF0|nr:hypothetical protein [Massilia sp. R2A-15]WLI91001.1 hypothetical protein Q4S45_07750 [Massilia sp. R2A-15]
MRILAARVFLAGFVVGMSLSLPGCAMYSETRHKQAISAKEAWKKVDLAGQLTVARKDEAALLAEQLRTEDALKRAARDRTALTMVLGGPIENTLLKPIRHDLHLLIGSEGSDAADASKADTLLAALADQVEQQSFLKIVEGEFTRFGLEMPSCASIIDGTADQSLTEWIKAHPRAEGEFIDAAWMRADTTCRFLVDATADVKAALDGSLKAKMAAINEASTSLEASQKAGANQRNRYRAAAKELDTAMKALQENPTGARDKVDAALERMKSLAGAIDKLPDAFSSKFISDARVKSLNDLVATVEKSRETGKAPDDATTAAKILTQFPDLIDRANVALADAQKPRLAPLVLMKNLENVRADAAARDVASQLTKASLLREQFRWELERLRAIRDAYDFLTNHCDPCLAWSLSEALQPVDDRQASGKDGMKLVEAKANVLKAASLYLDSKGRLEASVSKIQYQLNALEYERALAHAEGNIAQWNTLVTSVVDQMSDFGEMGIKKEDVAAFVTAAAMLWIGKGVN